MDKKTAMAFIPARKGSKGLPGKNKKLFHGKPLIQWSIDQAKESKLFDAIVVSSDDDDILQIAKDNNILPVERHEELATDDATIDEVLYDFLARTKCDYVCLLNPTSPLRAVKDIKEMYKYIKLKKYETVVSVKWSDFMGWVGQPNNLGPVCSYNTDKRPNRQSRPDFFLENGAIYWFKHELFLVYGNIIGNFRKTKLYEMPLERSLEIDNEFDWYMAERAYEYLSMEKSNT